MDETLDRLVSSASADQAEFIPSQTWAGPKPGYYFGTTEKHGTGYHLDRNGPARGTKRPRDGDENEHEGPDLGTARRSKVRFGADSTHSIPSRPKPKTGEELLAEAEAALDTEESPHTIANLDLSGMKSTALALEKAINKNQLDRAKFGDEPEKFMESELVLNDVVLSLKDVAANVSLYPHLVKLGTVNSLIGLLAHENGDVASSVLSVLVELLDMNLVTAPDADDDTPLNVGILARAVLDGGALDLITANLARFEEDVEEERQGLDDALTVMETLLDLESGGMIKVAYEAGAEKLAAAEDGEDVEDEVSRRAATKYRSVSEVALTSTTLLTWLLERVGRAGKGKRSSGGGGSAAAPTVFSPIALHASEVLSSLLQHDDARVHASNIASLPPFRSAFDEDMDSKPRAKPTTANGDKKGGPTVDGMECLLQAVAPYRKSDPESEEEVEFVENVLDAMAASLLNPENVRTFLDGQGVELMLRCVREGGHSGYGALRVLYFATSGPSSGAAAAGAAAGTAVVPPGGGGGGGDDPYKKACETLVEAGGLRTVFPLLMGRGSAIPKPARCSDAGRGLLAAAANKSNNGKNKNGGGGEQKKKGKRARRAEAARREWLREVEGNVIRVVYELTRHLDDGSPNEAKDRVLTKFLEGDCEKCDRLVELILKYDERTRLAEYQYYRSDEAEQAERSGTADMVDLAALNAKLGGGGDVLHRVCAVAAFASVGSRRCHEHVLEQLATKNSGMGVIKSALEEFTSMLDDGSQKTQLRAYLSSL